MARVAIADRVEWRRSAAGADALLPTLAGGTRVVRFTVPRTRGRLHVSLVIGECARPVNISRQPGTVDLLLAEAVSRTGEGGARQQFTARVIDYARANGCWVPRDGSHAGLLEVLGGSTFPLLGASYERGALARREVPVWASGILSCGSAREGAARAFAPASTTRAVVAALARSLARPGQPVDLAPMALATMASSVLDPDRVADLLETLRPPLVAGAHPAELDIEYLRLGRGACDDWGPGVVYPVLSDALAQPDGLVVLATILRAWTAVRVELRDRLPRNLAAMSRLIAEYQPIDPRPLRDSEQTSTREDASQGHRRLVDLRDSPRTATRTQESKAPVPTRPLRAPRTRSRATAGAFRYAPGLQIIDRAVIGDLRLILPRTPTELGQWAARLGNCLDTFGPAVSTGACTLIGVEFSDRLVYCLELSPRGRVRQFLGANNRPPERRHAESVIAFLRGKRVIEDG